MGSVGHVVFGCRGASFAFSTTRVFVVWLQTQKYRRDLVHFSCSHSDCIILVNGVISFQAAPKTIIA